MSLTPTKRSNDRSLEESNGKGKWQKSADNHSSGQALKDSSRKVFRLLCPASNIDSVTGKGGTIITQIHQETGVEVRVEETIPGCDERVITIINSVKEHGEDTEQSKEGCNEETDNNGKGDEMKDHHDNDEVKNSITVENSKCEKGSSSVQKALLLVFERMVKGEGDKIEGDEENNKSSSFVLRLLVFSSQVGCLLGKGGSVIKQMSADSGAQIRILPKDKFPLCASASDELVQITGEVAAVRKALQSAIQQLLDNLPRDHDPLSPNSTGPSTHSLGKLPPSSRSLATQGAPSTAGSRDSSSFHSAPPLIVKFHEGPIHGQMRPSQEMLTYRLLCHAERVGSIIGKGGTIIKTIQQETASEIRVVEGSSDSDDRIIVISGAAHPDDRVSPVQDAVLRVQTRIVRATPDAKEHSTLARILVSPNQIGCLIGKGGSIISEMRKLSGAHIRILGKDQVPRSGLEDDVVQISGEFEAVQDALMQITTRLRHHFFYDAYPSMNYSNSAFLDHPPPFPPYLGRRELSPPGMYSNLGPPFHKFDAHGAPPHRVIPYDDHPSFMHNIHGPGVPPHISERKPWGTQGLIEGGGPMSLLDTAGVPPRRVPGFSGGSHLPIITSTTVEVIVPRTVVPAIYGEDGECLRQIRQISDASVTITDPKPGAVETLIIISGTPEETHAAQSLIQAFVMSERESG